MRLTAVLLALALGAALAIATPLVLRRLPVPADEPEARPYGELDTIGFRLLAGAVAAVVGGIAFWFTPAHLWLAWSALVVPGTLLGLIDLYTGFLPMRLHYVALGWAGVGVVVAALLSVDWQVAAAGAAGGLAASGLYWLLWRFSSGRLGFGDVRLAGLLGLVTGATSMPVLLWSFLLGSLVGAIWAIAVSRKTVLYPYGPSMLSGPFLALILRMVLQLR